MLLSLDWDAYSGCRALVFDAPIWGTPDREHDRLAAWQARALKRDVQAREWDALEADFPLYPGWQDWAQYAGRPAWVCWSHAHAWPWLEQFPGREVLNIDSHHDLYSLSGDPGKLRPGNWAGLGLAADLISHYRVQYPAWHGEVPVAEGHDLERTLAELRPQLSQGLRGRLSLSRADTLPPKHEVEALLLVQSPSWSSPAHDAAFAALVKALDAKPISRPSVRNWPNSLPQL
ncbi:arginase [Deinococcus psychrotolerans]|uniref:Arginase n=1 Tax=Deinococcus psychrotolerans TaxID=2489213 RepID=A0A3G8YMQ4_9DEIO|nr:arginase [Deinococcus psychrotolerans]AZI42851.1 arginase [Deinococcus psychrotolerans]